MSSLEIVKEVLSREGFNSVETFARDWAYILSLSKLDQYRSEIEGFENKYGISLGEFYSLIHTEKGREDFKKEEDLEDWEFAVNALKWWEEKLKGLQVD